MSHSGSPEGHDPKGKKAETTETSPTEEFLALLPEGTLPEDTVLPEGFAAEALKLKLDWGGAEHKRINYPAFVLGPDSDTPFTLGSDWRRHAPPSSKAYQDAIENPKDGPDEDFRKLLKIVVDMGLPPHTD